MVKDKQQVGAECTCCGDCKCAEQEMLSLGEAFEAGALPGLQHVMSQKVADRCHAELLHKYQPLLNSPDTRAVAKQHLARLHSLQHSVATAWLGRCSSARNLCAGRMFLRVMLSTNQGGRSG